MTVKQTNSCVYSETMEVLLADEYGFCFGVERAVEMVEDALDEGVRPIRSLGPLIHNAQEMERLGELGVSTIDEPDEADADTIAVIRAHGVTPQVQRDLEDRAAKVIDATCPFVTECNIWPNALRKTAATWWLPAIRIIRK